MTIENSLGVFLNTGILATRAHDVGSLVQHQEEIMQKFLAARFETDACVAILKEAFRSYPYLEVLFDVESVARGGCVASQALLYELHQDRSTWSMMLAPKGEVSFMQQVPATEIKQIAELLRNALQNNDWTLLACALDAATVRDFQHATDAQNEQWPEFSGPGIQRLEHASVLIASETTRVVLDPISLAIGGNVGLPDLNLAPSNLQGHVDAIMITHGHLDHWHIPSILRLGGDGSVPVIVPHVPMASLLTQDDMKQSLLEVGQNAIDPAWWETVKIGDIEIDILPFYGEQPSIGDAKLPENLRNWGNCYRVTTPQFSVILLVDSGNDEKGSVFDVIEQSVAQRGAPDLILSCCREMRKAPFWQGLFTFWMVLPFSLLQKLPQLDNADDGPSITLGPEGIGDVCVRAGVSTFAPYANGFCGVAAEIGDIGWVNGEPSEEEALRIIEQRIKQQQGHTKVIRWLPGYSMALDANRQWMVKSAATK